MEERDRKSLFAIARSASPVDGFRFIPEPILLDETGELQVNVYDRQLTAHEDGWIHRLFCSEREGSVALLGDTSSAVATAGVCRTRDLIHRE